MADALDSKSSGVTPRAGSSPAIGTNMHQTRVEGFNALRPLFHSFRVWQEPTSLFVETCPQTLGEKECLHVSEAEICDSCRKPLRGKKTLWEYKDHPFLLCSACSDLSMFDRFKALKGRIQQVDAAAREQQAATSGPPKVQYRSDIREDQLESLLVHAFLDLIGERKAAGKRELAATMETIANWLADRTTLPVTPLHVQYLTLALRDGLIISVGGGGIGRPNSYDTRETAMGMDAFWDQVDAFLMVWRLPNRRALLEISPIT
jgi:hypothetical protein